MTKVGSAREIRRAEIVKDISLTCFGEALFVSISQDRLSPVKIPEMVDLDGCAHFSLDAAAIDAEEGMRVLRHQFAPQHAGARDGNYRPVVQEGRREVLTAMDAA